MVGKESFEDIINYNDLQIFVDINLAKDDRKLLSNIKLYLEIFPSIV